MVYLKNGKSPPYLLSWNNYSFYHKKITVKSILNREIKPQKTTEKTQISIRSQYRKSKPIQTEGRLFGHGSLDYFGDWPRAVAIFALEKKTIFHYSIRLR